MLCAGHRLGGDVVESWLREAEPLSLRDGVLTLGAPNGTARDWIDKKYGATIAAAFQEVNGQDVMVHDGDVFDAKHPIVKGREYLFKPRETHGCANDDGQS